MNWLRYGAKALVHGAIEWSGRPRKCRAALCGELVILTYHSFCESWPHGLFCSLPIDRFERQVRFLRSNFEIVSLEQGMANLESGSKGMQPWLSVTIDDGFLDNFALAWPVLRRYGVPFTIFVATDFIDNGRPPWPIQLAEIIERTSAPAMEEPFRANLGSLRRRGEAVQRLKGNLSRLSPDDRFKALGALRAQLKVGEDSRHLALTWDQIREMRKGGVKFGSHTACHSILPAVDGPVARWELEHSKRRIEEQLEESCTLFAYPDGKHDERSARLLESCGYRAAVTQDAGTNDEVSNRFELRRIEMPFNDPMPSFRCRASAALAA